MNSIKANEIAALFMGCSQTINGEWSLPFIRKEPIPSESLQFDTNITWLANLSGVVYDKYKDTRLPKTMKEKLWKKFVYAQEESTDARKLFPSLFDMITYYNWMTGEFTWIQTDPDNKQFGVQITKNKYAFKEFNRDHFGPGSSYGADYSWKDNWADHEHDESLWVEDEIDIQDHVEKWEYYVSAYYKNMNEVRETYPDDWRFILAECIFEQTNGLY